VDALLLAAAGLARLGFSEPAAQPLPVDESLPAVGQGALALECRADDGATRALLAAVDQPAAATAVAAERAFLAAVGGDCNSAIAAHATLAGGRLTLRALVTDPDGRRRLEERDTAPAADAEALGRTVATRLLAAGPAYAGIPATHRDHASLVTIATGHQARSASGAEPTVPALPWAALARQGGTLVFLMGMRQLPGILAALMEHGLGGDTPAAAVA